MKFGILTSGVDCAGLNAVIRSIGLYLCFGAIIPFLFYLSHWMLIRCQMGRPIPFLPWGPARKKTLLWILIPTFVLLAAGCLTLMLSISSLAPYPWFSG